MIVRDFEDADRYLEVLRSDPEKPFNNVMIIPGNADSRKGSRIGKYIIQFLNILRLRRTLNKWNYRVGRTYVFNDSRAEGQYMLHANSTHKGRNIYVEDGFGAYSESHFKSVKTVERYVAKIAFGWWYLPVDVVGTHPLFDHHLVLLPDMVRYELRDKGVNKLDSSVLLDSGAYCQKLLHEFGHSSPPPRVIVVLPLSDSIPAGLETKVTKNYRKIIQKIMNEVGEVGIKFHPRETREQIYNDRWDERVLCLPKAVPLEALLIPHKSSVDILVGGASTAMLTGRIILGDEARIISTTKLDYDGDSSERELLFLKKINVETPQDIECMSFE